MGQEGSDQTPHHIAQLCIAMDKLGRAISAQGIGVSEKLDHSSVRVKEAVDRSTDQMAESIAKASEASERHAKSLVWATWALVLATIVLVVVTGVSLFSHS